MPSSSDALAPENGCTLLLSPPWNEDVDRVCLERVTNSVPRERDVVVVSYARPSEVVVRDWRTHLGEQPRNLGVVDLGSSMRSIASPGYDSTTFEIANVAVSLPDPSDTSALLEVVEGFLDDWVGNDGSQVAYVDSVTAMVHRIGLPATVEFIDSLRTTLAANGGTGFVRLEKAAHDQRTLVMLDPLFDSVLELVSDGGWSWSERPRAAGSTRRTQAVMPAGTVDRAFDLLSDRRRRLLLHALRLADRPLPLPELARFVADHETAPDDEPSEDTCSRVYTSLWHVHVPMLADANVVSLDEAANTVELADSGPVEPFLSMTAMEDARE